MRLSPELPGLSIDRWTQRNWSRVAVAHDESGGQWFVKQFVDARGRLLAAHFDAEQRTAEALAGGRLDSLVPLLPARAHPSDLVLVYPYLDDLVTLDVQAATAGPDELGQIAGALLSLMTELASPRLLDLTTPLPSGSTAAASLGWKGLDIKNLSLRADGRLIGFDFGPLMCAPRTEVAARLIASALVANWGRPVRRSLAGPPRWLRPAMRPLGNLTTRQAVDSRLARLLRQRLEEPQRVGLVEHLLTRPMTRLLAPRYWKSCAQWTAEHLSNPPLQALEIPPCQQARARA